MATKGRPEDGFQPDSVEQAAAASVPPYVLDRDSLASADAIVDLAVAEVMDLEVKLRQARVRERQARAARARRAGLLK